MLLFLTLQLYLPVYHKAPKLGPIGFQVIINDAVQNISCPISCLKYVDDLTIAENCMHPDSSQLQVILDSFSQWTENNSPSLNPAKCQALQICFKTDAPHPSEFKINSRSLNFVDHAKILGVWLQHDLSWDKTISEMISNSSLTLKQTKTIENVQRRACRIVLGHNFLSYKKCLVIVRLNHWSLGGKTIASSLPKGLLTLKGQTTFFHLLGWRVIPAIFTMHTRSPNCILGLCVLKIALSLTSSSC